MYEEGAEEHMEYTRGEHVCPACNGTKWVSGNNSPSHPCSKCASMDMRGETRKSLYTSSMHSQHMPEEI